MVAVKMEVLGTDGLTKTLQAIAAQVSGMGLRGAVDASARVILEEAKANIRKNFEPGTGNLENSGRVELERKSRTRLVSNIIFDVVYAAVHEYGLERQPITDLQRGFFWWMHAETGDDMWKALALSRTYTIPARPYLRPAIDSKQREAIAQLALVIAAEIGITARRHRPAATVRGGGKLNY